MGITQKLGQLETSNQETKTSETQTPNEKQKSQYKILELVGQGSYGRVYCASHRKTGELFALKELDQKRFPSKKFLREFRFLASLQHRNIVGCHALEYNETGRYLVMDYCEGGTMRQHIEFGELSLVEGLKLVQDVLRGLHYIHARGLVHCDLKPENILLHLGAKGWVAKLSDFGIARSPEESVTGSMGDTGSPAYMSPERFYGNYSFSSDLYAVGVILYELAVGERPFSGMPAELMSAHINQAIDIPKEVPYLVRCAIKQALQKLPQQRFENAKEMYNAVQLALDVVKVSPEKTSLSVSFTPISACVVRQETLGSPISAIATDQQQIYLGTAKQVICKTYSQSPLTGEVAKQWQVNLPQPVKELVVRSRGCFALTSNYSLYCFPKTSLSLWKASNYALFSFPVRDLLTAIDPEGDWVALALGDASTHVAHYDAASFQLLTLPELNSVQSPLNCPFPFGLVALNRDRGLVAFPRYNQKTDQTSTLLRIFDRQGRFSTRLNFPFPIQQLTLSCTPNHLFAIQVTKTKTYGLILNLQPFQVSRLTLNFTPDWIIPTSWGYVLATTQGKLSLIQSDGKAIGNFQFPTKGEVTALSACEEYGLLVATHSGEEGILYSLDLKKLMQ